jgi:hypothetical protein
MLRLAPRRAGGRLLASPFRLWHHAPPWRPAWRAYLNTSVVYTSISDLIEGIQSRSTSNDRTLAVRSVQKSILGMMSWGRGIRRTRRRRILRKNGRRRDFQRRCIQGHPGRAGLSPKSRLLLNRLRLQNRPRKRMPLHPHSPLMRPRALQLRSRRRPRIRRPAKRASSTSNPSAVSRPYRGIVQYR